MPTDPNWTLRHAEYLQLAIDRRNRSADPALNPRGRRVLRSRMRFWAKLAVDMKRWHTSKLPPKP